MMTNDELIRDLWILRDREDLLQDCFAYCEEHKHEKPLVICVVHFLQQAIRMNGLSNQNLDQMEKAYMEDNYDL